MDGDQSYLYECVISKLKIIEPINTSRTTTACTHPRMVLIQATQTFLFIENCENKSKTCDRMAFGCEILESHGS